MVIRKMYLDRLRDFYHSDLVKVILGIRRCGKSELLKQIQNELISEGINEDQIIYLNMEDLANIKYQDPGLLNDYLNQIAVVGLKLYLFIDEVQMINQFERLINSLRASGRFSIFITGSNSTLLSGKLATLLTGRTISVQMLPFTFSESVEQAKVSKNREQEFLIEYIKLGGMPQRFEFSNEQSCSLYLEDLLHSIIYRDVLVNLKRADKKLTEKLLAFLFDNTANTFSDHSIYEQLKLLYSDVGKNRIYDLVEKIEQAMLVHKCSRYDIKGKHVLTSLEKYYCSDLGLRTAMRLNANPDFGKALETIVYLELTARGYEVYVGKTYKGEVDFFVKKQNQRIYLQVAWSLVQENTREREFSAFLPIADNHPKFIISNDRENYSSQGITHIDAINFLMDRVDLWAR